MSASERAWRIGRDFANLYWIPDHIDNQTPRPLWDKQCTAAARLLRSPDAAMEAWTLLGSLANFGPIQPGRL